MVASAAVMRLTALLVLATLLLATPTMAQYGYYPGAYGGGYGTGRRLFSADSRLDHLFQGATGAHSFQQLPSQHTTPLFGTRPARSLLATYGGSYYGYGGGYGTGRRLLQVPSYGGYGYGYYG